MKKLMFIVAALCGIILCSSKCSNEKTVLGGSEIIVENTTALDREAMFMKGNDYRWYETGVVLKDWLDEESDGTIEMVVNVFQAIIAIDSTSADTYVYKFQHTVNGVNEECVHGLWIEDYPLNDERVSISFKEAFERVMESNYPKPHTHQVVLRKQVGPVDANAQWIFGNLQSQIYVDAITGEVTDKNPAFKGYGFKMPLGEWP